MNIALITGTLSSDPVTHDLPSGDVLLRLEMTIPRKEGRAETVPVVVFDPARSLTQLRDGDEVVAYGRIRRRFFRQVGQTRSATEVVAERVVLTRHRRRSAQLVATAVERAERFAEDLTA